MCTCYLGRNKVPPFIISTLRYLSVSRYASELLEKLQYRAQESNKNIIVVGDLNQDLLLDFNNHLTNIMSINNLTNVIKKPTRVTNNTATLMCHTLTKST